MLEKKLLLEAVEGQQNSEKQDFDRDEKTKKKVKQDLNFVK